MNGRPNEPTRVPAVYVADTEDRVRPRSSMMKSRKTDTPGVWPGMVIQAPIVPAANTTHE
jgi:hypothetical protein